MLSLANQRQRITVESSPGPLDTFPLECGQVRDVTFEKYSSPPTDAAKHVAKPSSDIPFRVKPCHHAEHKRQHIHPKTNPTKLRNRLRTRKNAATAYIPSQLMLGRELVKPDQWSLHPPPDKPDWVQDGRNHGRYEKRHAKSDCQRTFEIDQPVLIRRPRLSRSNQRVHVTFFPRLKPWTADSDDVSEFSPPHHVIELRRMPRSPNFPSLMTHSLKYHRTPD